MPRSVPLVGGMVLSLMTLPTIIIVTRAALKQVPSSIYEGAIGIGASKHEAIFHHMLPLAMPSIMTGAIIGLAQALGETAPLLLVGMNAFITSDPWRCLEPATALADTDLHLGGQSGTRICFENIGRHSGAAGIPDRDECHRGVHEQAVRAPLVTITPGSLICSK